MSTLDLKFNEMKQAHFSKNQIRKGYIVILRLQNISFYWKIIWEIFTTIFIYSPSVTDFSKSVIIAVRNKWNRLSDKDQINVIATLVHLNKRGKIDKILSGN